VRQSGNVWQLVSNVREADMSHVCDTDIKETHSTEPPGSFTDWQVVLRKRMSHIYMTYL